MSLIDKYLPSDYSDCVSRRIKHKEPLSPDCLFEEMFCKLPKPEDGWQDAAVTTVVRFNNFLGKIYFIGIWVFHKLIVKSLFRKAIRERK